MEVSPLELHFVMFLPTLQGQCSPEQFDKWYPRALTFEIVGTYAQTELGHGTNLQKLETTATYDSRSQEFVIHSPTLTSTKWWPGNRKKYENLEWNISSSLDFYQWEKVQIGWWSWLSCTHKANATELTRFLCRFGIVSLINLCQVSLADL